MDKNHVADWQAGLVIGSALSKRIYARPFKYRAAELEITFFA